MKRLVFTCLYNSLAVKSLQRKDLTATMGNSDKRLGVSAKHAPDSSRKRYHINKHFTTSVFGEVSQAVATLVAGFGTQVYKERVDRQGYKGIIKRNLSVLQLIFPRPTNLWSWNKNQ